MGVAADGAGGRVFTHRLGADEVAHDLLTVTPNLDPITALCEHEQYQRLADGSPAQVVLAGFDEELLEQRGIPPEVVDPLGALVLAPGTLGKVRGDRGRPGRGAADPAGTGGRAGRRARARRSTAGVRLRHVDNADEPVYFDAASMDSVRRGSGGIRRAAAAPVRDRRRVRPYPQHRMARTRRIRFRCLAFRARVQALARRHDLDSDDALALYTLVETVSTRCRCCWLDATGADEPLADTPVAASAGATRPRPFVDLMREVGAVLADPLLAELLLAETVGTGRAGAAALGLFAETLEPKVPRTARVAFRWLRAVALERHRRHRGGRTRAAGGRVDGSGLAAAVVRSGPFRLRSRRRRARVVVAAPRRRRTRDDLLASLLEQHRAEPRPDIGRNEPCWCGSGRKYKKCHLGREQLPLADRVGWLYTKAASTRC